MAVLIKKSKTHDFTLHDDVGSSVAVIRRVCNYGQLDIRPKNLLLHQIQGDEIWLQNQFVGHRQMAAAIQVHPLDTRIFRIRERDEHVPV